MLNCINCSEVVPESRRECPACGEHNGFPNVRAAEIMAERAALQGRVKDANTSASARGVASELIAFQSASNQSKAVISRALSDVQFLAKGDQFSYASFAKQIRAGTRTATDGPFDKTRLQYENALFPNYSEEILFGSLSLSERGMSGYGGYDIVLKDKMIAGRASVFEENPYNFAIKHHLGLTDVIPPGYRASWNSRSDLCVAKLHGNLEKGMVTEDFATIIQGDNGGTGDSDFVEVHIFGTLNRKTIEKVIAESPTDRSERLLWKVASRDLAAAGVETETR